MDARERMLRSLVDRRAPTCDDCVWQLAGMSSRQQANSGGRQLAEMGTIRRGRGTCSVCGGYKTVSVPTGVELPAAVNEVVGKPWFWEGNVQAALVEHLVAEGWSITNTANTATKEAGVDVKALDLAGAEWWVSVKGYPEDKAGKTTRPSMQARHWFSHAMFDVVMYRTERPDVNIGVAIPGPYGTYEKLAVRSSWLREAAPFVLFTVRETGSVFAEPAVASAPSPEEA